MKFIDNIDKIKYDEFVTHHKKSHFLQSYDWGEFARKEKNLTPHYVGLQNEDGALICATLLLEKHLPFGYSYLYAPRGFVIDFNDIELVTEFVSKIKENFKNKKVIFLKMDPDLVITKTNYNEESLKPDYDKDKIIKDLKRIGFHHLGFTQEFETMQPRFSFRIDNSQSLEEVYDHFSKTTKQRIKKAEDKEVETRIGTKEDIKEFYKLMRITENRKDFVTHNLSYYETLYDIFHKNDGANLFLGKVNMDKMIEKDKNDLIPIKEEEQELISLESRSKTQNTKLKELEKRRVQIEKRIEEYKKIKEEFGTEIILNGHFIIKYGDMAWVLYAGNHNILTDTYANYKTYLEHITYYHDKVKIYDQFGTVGCIDKENHLYGLHEFKKKFGGDYVEFIGEFDLILNKPMYFIFTKLVPLYRKIIKNIAKKKNRR